MAFFTFTDASRESFVFRLDDPGLIAHARALLAGGTEADARIGGTVVKDAVAYNIGWSYHLAPDSIFFFEMSTEVGDSTMRYIEDHLPEIGGHLLPGKVWTGWSSELTGELRLRPGAPAAETLTGDGGGDLMLGRGGDDRLVGLGGDDWLSGGEGNDRLLGGDGADRMDGGDGRDVLHGGAGNDLLIGGRGNDRLAGGAGRDVFRVDAPEHSGRDLVRDFEGGAGPGDRLQLDRGWLAAVGDRTGDGLCNRADLAAAFRPVGDDLVLRLDGQTSITLRGAAGTVLDADDFLLF